MRFIRVWNCVYACSSGACETVYMRALQAHACETACTRFMLMCNCVYALRAHVKKPRACVSYACESGNLRFSRKVKICASCAWETVCMRFMRM